METTTAGWRAGRDVTEGPKQQGELKINRQSLARPKALPHSFCSILCSITTWGALSFGLPLLPVAVLVIGIASQTKMVTSSCAFINKVINYTKLSLPDKMLLQTHFHYSLSSARRNKGLDRRKGHIREWQGTVSGELKPTKMHSLHCGKKYGLINHHLKLPW